MQLTPYASLRTEYNDNIFFDTQNEESDYIVRVTPGLELTGRTERLDASLLAEMPVFRYSDTDALDDVDQHYSGRLRYLLTDRLSASLRAGFSRTSQPDRDILETGLVIGSVIRHRYLGGISSEYSLSEISSIGVSYDYSKDDYDDPAFVNIASHNASVSYGQDLSRIYVNTRGRISFGYGLYEFSDSSVDNYWGTAGFVKRLSELYSLSVDVGVRYTRSEFEVLRLVPVSPGLARIVRQTESSEDWGPVARASFSYGGEYTTASFTLYEDISTSGGEEGTVERTSFVFDVGRRFTYELWGHLSAGYYLNRSEETQFALEEIDEETWRINPYVRYNFSRNLSLDASYSYTRVADKTNDTEAERNMVFLLLSYRHPLFD